MFRKKTPIVAAGCALLFTLSGCGGGNESANNGAPAIPSSIDQAELDALPTEQTKLVYRYLHYLADGNAAEANKLTAEPVPESQLLPAEEYLKTKDRIQDIQIDAARSDGTQVYYSVRYGDDSDTDEHWYLLDKVDGQWKMPSHLALADSKSSGVCPTYAVIPGKLVHECKLDYGTIEQYTSTALMSPFPTILKPEVTDPAPADKLNDLFTPLIDKAIEKSSMKLRCWQEDKWGSCPAGASAAVESTQVYGLEPSYSQEDGSFLAVLASTSLSADFGDGQQVPALFGTKEEPIQYKIVADAKGKVKSLKPVTSSGQVRVYPKQSIDKLGPTGWWYTA